MVLLNRARNASQWAVATSAIVVLCGCGKLAGIDDYGVGSGPGGRSSCGATAVPNADGECGVPVGPRSCIDGARPDEDGNCAVLLPAAPCEAQTCERPPCNVSPEQWGLVTCASNSGWFGCPPEGADYADSDSDRIDPSVRYVKQGFAGDSDGSHGKPWTSIGQALEDVPPGGTVFVAAGTYEEDLVLNKPRVALRGACPDQVVVIGSGERIPEGENYPCKYSDFKAALCVASSAHDSQILGINFTGAGDGIAVVGATGVLIGPVAITQTERYGIRVEELEAPNGALSAASVTLTAVSVRRARGAGIYVAGAKLDNTGFVTVFATRQLNGYLGHGISALPGAWPANAQTRIRADVVLSDTVLIGNADAALHVSGSSATMSDSFLGNLDTAYPTGRGVLVERNMTIGDATGEVTLRRTIVQRTRDAAIDVRSAEIALEDVTIRDTFGREKDGCSGQAIRLRADRVAPAKATVTHSLIAGSGQAAIHTHGGTVMLEKSILRGSAPEDDAAESCAPHLGDGVTLHSLPAPGDPAVLQLDHVLIEDNARAGIASFGGTASATASVLLCNQHGLAAPVAVPDLWCGCGGNLSPCSADAVALEPWVSPGLASGHAGATEDWVAPIKSFPQDLFLPNGVAFILDAPEVAPAFPDEQGCATLTGVPKDLDHRLAVWAERQVPAVWHVPQGVAPSCTARIRASSAEQAAILPRTEPANVNKCNPFLSGPTSEAGVVQIPESGVPWLELNVPPLGQFLLRWNVDPGWHDFARTDNVICSQTPATGSGEVVPGAPNARRVLLEPGMTNNVWWDNCYIPHACGAGFPDPAQSGQCLTGTAAVAACADDLKTLTGNTRSPECVSCLCTSCLPLYAACLSDIACRNMAACAVRTGCSLDGCSGPCPTEIAALGASGPLATALGSCRLAADCKTCDPPAEGG
jgi:hypothetical protein